MTSQLISAEWLSSFTWAISSSVSKTIENSRMTARPRQLYLTLKSFRFSCSGCALPCLGGAGWLMFSSAVAHSQHSSCLSEIQWVICSITIFATYKSANLFMLYTAVQHMHKSVMYMCICTGTTSIQVAAARSSHGLIFLANNSLYKLVCSCCRVLYLAAPAQIHIPSAVMTTVVSDFVSHRDSLIKKRLYLSLAANAYSKHVLKSNSCLMKGNTVFVFWYSEPGFITA